MAVALCGPDDHIVQFASDDDCAFYVAAYDAVPALLDEVEALEMRLEQLNVGALEQTEVALAIAESGLKAATARIADLEKQLEVEIDERTKAQKRARSGLVVARKFVELSKELEALRGSKT